MDSDRDRWNPRYREGEPPQDPTEVVRRFFRLSRGPRALDLACGAGRNAVFLAAQGFEVDALDIAELALARFTAPGVRRACLDLDRFDLPRARYDLIVDTLYVNRRLFPQMREALRPDGLLIVESLLEPPGGPGEVCRDYLLRPNELLHSFISLRILHYAEAAEAAATDGRHLATLVARKA